MKRVPSRRVELDGVELAYDEAGEGPAVVLLHAGIGDRGLWVHQFDALASHYRVVRYDARGFGHSPLPGGPFSFVEDLGRLLDELGVEQPALVGNSLGARTALDYALAETGRVAALVLTGPAPMGPPSPELEAFNAEEDALLDAGKVDEAVELNIRLWLGTGCSPEVRERVGGMQRHAFEVQLEAYEREPGPGPVSWLPGVPANERLAEVAAPTLVLVGDGDVRDVQAAAELLAGGIPGARTAVVAGAGHVPGLERPEEFNRVVLEFLASVLN